jgi:hypothetical protein
MYAFMSVVHHCTTKLLDRPFIMFCSTVRYIYVIACTPESTRKLPPRDLQDTVHIVYFYIVKVRSGIYRQFCSKKSCINLTRYHLTVAFSWRVASPPHRPSPPIITSQSARYPQIYWHLLGPQIGYMDIFISDFWHWKPPSVDLWSVNGH